MNRILIPHHSLKKSLLLIFSGEPKEHSILDDSVRGIEIDHAHHLSEKQKNCVRDVVKEFAPNIYVRFFFKPEFPIERPQLIPNGKLHFVCGENQVVLRFE